MTTATLSKLEAGFSMGLSDTEACLYANIGTKTLYRYCEDNLEFRQRKEELKNHPKLKAKKIIDEQLADGDQATAKWYLERRDDDFKTKIKQEHDVTVKEPPKDITQSLITSDTT